MKFDLYRQVYKSGPRPTIVLTLLASPPNTSSEDLIQGFEAYTFSSLKNRTPLRNYKNWLLKLTKLKLSKSGKMFKVWRYRLTDDGNYNNNTNTK